jgi:hypothetical protein
MSGSRLLAGVRLGSALIVLAALIAAGGAVIWGLTAVLSGGLSGFAMSIATILAVAGCIALVRRTPPGA